MKMLREVTGLTRATLKTYLSRYPSIAIDMFVGPVKSSKSVIMRMLGVSDDEYMAGLKKIQKQTNNKPGTLFRGSFPLIVASLKDSTLVGLSRRELRTVFLYYPTLFTLDEGYVARRLRYLRGPTGYTAEELKRMLLSNPRSILYDQDSYKALKCFFKKEVGLVTEFCEVTSRESRLVSTSLKTLASKTDHLRKTWKLSKAQIRKLVLCCPTVLTTPQETTARLYEYLHTTLRMPTDAVRDCVVKYPGFLRSNPTSLTRRLEYVVAVQVCMKVLLLKLSADRDECRVGMARGAQRISPRFVEKSTFFSNHEDLVEAVDQVLLRLASLLVAQSGIVFTFSDERLSSRLMTAAAYKHGRSLQAYYGDDDYAERENESWQSERDDSDFQTRNSQYFREKFGAVADDMRANGIILSRTLWPLASGETSDTIEGTAQVHSIYRPLAKALVQVIGARACAMLVFEAVQVRKTIGDRGQLTRLLPFPPQQTIMYAEGKFEKWLQN